MLDTANQMKRVSRDCLLGVMNYEVLVSNISTKTMSYCNQRNKDVNKANKKLFKILLGTQTYAMSCWRRCPNEHKFRQVEVDDSNSANETENQPFGYDHTEWNERSCIGEDTSW